LIYFSQRDPQWENSYFTCSNGKTVPFSQVGCGETVTAMVLSTYIDSAYTPDEVKKKYFSNPNYCSGTGVVALNNALADNGLSVEKSPSLNVLKNSLSGGEVAIVGIKFWNGETYTTHHTLAIGVDNKGNIIFNDPWFGPNTTLKNVDYEIMGSEIVKKPKI